MSSASPAVEAAGSPERRTVTHELFFDLVFVYGITQISKLLARDLTAAGAGRAAIVLALVWWVWSQYTWALNAVDPRQPLVTAAVIGAAGVALFAAQGIPDAYGGAGRWFAVSYMALHLFGLTLYWAGVRHDPHHRSALAVYLPVASVAPLVVLAGGFASAGARPWVWGAAVVVDVAGALRAGRARFTVATAHFAERYGLIVLIALGEAIVAIGAGAAEYDRNGDLALAMVTSMLIVGGLYLSYFGWVADASERRLEHASDDARGRTARDLYTFLHFPIVAGIVTTAVAIEAVVAHPLDPLDGAVRLALAGGIALFLSGFLVGNFVAAGTVLVERAVAVVAVAAICILGAELRATVLAALVGSAVFVALAVEHVRRAQSAGRPLGTALAGVGPGRGAQEP